METSAARDLRTSHQGTESCNKCTQRRRARARRPAALRKLSARETTGRATEAVGTRDGRAQDRPESDKRYISGDQRGARPVARAAGRAEHQPVRVTSALKKGPRAASAGRARPARSVTSGTSYRTSDTSAGRARPARSETSGASYRTSDISAGRARPARSETSGASYRTSETSSGRAETSRRSETSGASCRTSQEPAVPRDECGQKRISHLGRRPRDERAWREPSFG